MDMEFLDLQIDKMEEVAKTKVSHDFPVVTFSKCENCYMARFNKRAREMFGNCTHVKIYANAEYIVFSPSDRKDYHSYKLTFRNAGDCSTSCSKLERFVLDGKSYKLHNTKKGLAIKINEPIKNRK